jgi:hypothetical protein
LQTTVTLEWITPQELAVAFRQQNLAVELVSLGGPRVSIKGYDPDYGRAQALVRTLDAPPPIPQFVVVGIATSDQDRYATLKVNGTAYTVAEGRAIPGIGWSITAITRKTVYLRTASNPYSFVSPEVVHHDRTAYTMHAGTTRPPRQCTGGVLRRNRPRGPHAVSFLVAEF